MKKLLAIGLLSLGLITAPSLANAEHGPDHGKGKKGSFFEKIDTNGDGVISKAEHDAHSAERFKKMDRNGDGQITKDEIEAGKAEWKAKRDERRKGMKKPGDETLPVETPVTK